VATIYPIAGTFRRTGNDQADAQLAQELYDDPKENAEHVMLVDLARNDLSRNGTRVEVETFKEIQYYSHVIHLVSKVTGRMDEGVATVQMVADTFRRVRCRGRPSTGPCSSLTSTSPRRGATTAAASVSWASTVTSTTPS
jgi:anthranilate synthase component 1